MRVRHLSRGSRAIVALAALALVTTACSGDDTASDNGSNGTDSASSEETTGTSDETASASGEATDASDAAATFYEGETVRLVVPYDPGGGFDTYARGLAPYLGEALGTNVTVENVPGAGGLLGANDVYTAEPDGLTIGLINYPGAIFAELSGQEGAVFDNTQWQVLGRVAAVNPLIYAAAGSDLTTAEDMINATEPVVFGLGGVGSDAYYGTIVTAETLGMPYDLVTGYEGSGEADAALVAGEVDASFNSVDSALAFVESGDAVGVMAVGTQRFEALPDVPTVIELADGEDEQILQALASIYDLERILVTGADVPDDRVQYLRDAIAEAMASDGFLTDMEEAGRSLNTLDGQAAQELVNNVGTSVDRLRPLIEEAAG